MKNTVAISLCRIFLLALWVFFSSKIGVCDATEKDVVQDDQDVIGAIASGYLTNREQFEFFQIEFTYRTGRAMSIDAALAGNLLADAVEAKCIWIFNDGKIRFERNLDQQLLESMINDVKKNFPNKGGTSFGAIPMRGMKFLGAPNKVQMRYSQSMNAAVVQDFEILPAGLTHTPFDMGIMGADEIASPGKLLLNSISGEDPSSCVYKGQITEDGVALESIERNTTDGWRYVYMFNPNEGFLATRVNVYRPNGTIARRAFVTTTRQCSNDGWLPIRSVVISGEEAGIGQVTVDEYTINNFDVDKRPDEALFKVDLPADALVNNGFEVGSQFRLEKPVSVTLDTAAELFTRSKNQAAGYVLKEANTATGWSRSQQILIVANVIVIVVVALLLLRRKMRAG